MEWVKANGGAKHGHWVGSSRAPTKKLRRLGVDVNVLGYYDQLAFRALEETDPLALELYSSWVIHRPRDEDYDAQARQVVPRARCYCRTTSRIGERTWRVR